jgi:prepilin-type N-terminal cleavage/methylation domain-containing protein
MNDSRSLRSRGFTLIEISIVIGVIAILASALAPSLFRLVGAASISAERTSLTELRSDIELSFTSTNQAQNVGMISGTGITAGTTSTTATGLNVAFDNTTTILNANDWRAKVAAVRGAVGLGYPSTESDPAGGTTLGSIALNSRRWARVLLIGPTTESTQRYLLISLMTPASKELVFPAGPDHATIFNEIWNTSWGSNATLPAAWAPVSRVAATDQVLWAASSAGAVNATLVMVERITQPKVGLVVVNVHATERAYVDIGPFTQAIELPPANAGGVVRSSSIPEFAQGIPVGREIVVRRGTSYAAAIETQRFTLSANTNITVQ